MERINKKRMSIMLIVMAILFGGIFIFKTIGGLLFMRAMAHQKNPPVTVSATKADYSTWQSHFKYYASLRAIRGINVTTELSGIVQTVYFKTGDTVKKDAVLLQLNADAETAQLNALQAQANLAQKTYVRDKAQYDIKAISKAALDTDEANLKNLQALVNEQAATVVKKTILAPFSGRLGISTVNPGQYLSAGQAIVPLQELDSMYADFYVPQQDLTELQTGQTVTLTVDTFPDKTFTGQITAINPVLDTSTRNVEVEATFVNPNDKLIPGMSGDITVTVGQPQELLTLPQTAITFNPYGSLVYIIKKNKEDQLTAEQAFVMTGQTRGDQIAILSGLTKGEEVVTAGQIKLKNGSTVVINNAIQPSDSATPHVTNDY